LGPNDPGSSSSTTVFQTTTPGAATANAEIGNELIKRARTMRFDRVLHKRTFKTPLKKKKKKKKKEKARKTYRLGSQQVASANRSF
jgi:hypothetical protein